MFSDGFIKFCLLPFRIQALTLKESEMVMISFFAKIQNWSYGKDQIYWVFFLWLEGLKHKGRLGEVPMEKNGNHLRW